jgi:hypothetical protein
MAARLGGGGIVSSIKDEAFDLYRDCVSALMEAMLCGKR